MPRLTRRALAVAAASLVAAPLPAAAQTPAVPPGTPNSNIFDPLRAPEVILRIGVRRAARVVPHHEASGETLSTKTLESQNVRNFKQAIINNVPGAASAPSGEFHIRGSHGQYTYYLDGAPLPLSVSGSFSDLIDPKNIETLRILTGGFPAQYGDNLAAVFDVTAKAGRPGVGTTTSAGHRAAPGGFVQQIVQGYSTYQSTVQFGGSAQSLSYFLSGVHSSTDRQLDPVTQDPIHDAGGDAVVFGKFDYQAGPHDRLILDTAHSDARFQLPNEAERQALGQDQVQRENNTFTNLILHHDVGVNTLTTALYSHESRLRYTPSSADLVGATPDNPRASAFEDRNANYVGLRTDAALRAGARHKIGLGFDVDTLTGREKFALSTTDGTTPPQTLAVDQAISGGDRGFYVQDDWTPGRWLVNYGVRYDIHKAVQEDSQLSPRLNLTYTAGRHDKVHAYYNRLFQPAPIEDVRQIDPNATTFKPERDDFYEVGYQHASGGVTLGLNAYYKTERDVIDENLLAGTRIREPFNVARGYVRGVELSADGSLGRVLSFYGNFARSWAQAAGEFTGGLVPVGAPPGYFYDDHDQRDTASVGLDYDNKGSTFSINGEYGSGFPFGQDAAGHVNIFRVSPHFIVNLDAGMKVGSGQLAFTVDNLLNHPYVIKQASPFTDREWGQARTYGVKFTQNF